MWSESNRAFLSAAGTGAVWAVLEATLRQKVWMAFAYFKPVRAINIICYASIENIARTRQVCARRTVRNHIPALS